MEVTILRNLNWRLLPETPMNWLMKYMQIMYQQRPIEDNFSTAAYPSLNFAKVSQLMDLSIMDSASLNYKYSILATAAIYLAESPQISLFISGNTALIKYTIHTIQKKISPGPKKFQKIIFSQFQFRIKTKKK